MAGSRSICDTHNSIMDSFEAEKKTLPALRARLEEIRAELRSKASEPVWEWSSENLKNDEKNLAARIHSIEVDEDMSKYLLKVSSSIFTKMATEKKKKRKPADESSLNSRVTAGIEKFMKIHEVSNRGDLLTEYLNIISNVPDKNRMGSTDVFFCRACSCKRTLNSKECLLICENCGQCEPWQDPDLPQWVDTVNMSKSYKYKRLGYFIEHLYRMQAKERTVVPGFVVSKIMVELRTRMVTEPSKLNPKLIRQCLKSMGLTSYYENVNRILRELTGRAAPEFPEDLEDKLANMFMQSLPPFEKFKHLIPCRSNYLSYPYTIRKLLKIISFNEADDSILEFVECFSLLKNAKKIQEQENVWRKICKESNWPFFSTV